MKLQSDINVGKDYNNMMDRLGEDEQSTGDDDDETGINDASRLLSDEDLPRSLIITNLDVKVFDEDKERLNFEEVFRAFEEEVTFQYFKSFRRARVNFSTSASATNARIQLHQAVDVCGKIINCYFAQPSTRKDAVSDPYLQLPAPVKQFLISPPASPPVGWEPVDEAEPVINYDLLAAIANLTPGESHELHPPSETQPGIVVHICEEEEKVQLSAGGDDRGMTKIAKPKIAHTKCPERAT